MRIEVQGLYKLWVERDGVVTQETPWFDNLITDNGMDLIGTSYNADNCYVGHGTADARYDDDALGGYVAQVSRIEADFTSDLAATQPYRGRRYTYRSGIGSIAGPISEVGIGNAWDNLVSRAILPNALLLDGDVDRLYVMWEFRQCIPQGTFGFDAVIAGATRACVAYACDPTGSKWGIVPGESLFFQAENKSSYNRIRLDGAWVHGDFADLIIGYTDSYARRRSYVPGSHKLTFDIHYGPGLTGAIDGARFGQGGDRHATRSNGGYWQVDISPPIQLEDHQRIHLTFDLFWTRCGSSSDGMGDPGTPHIAGEVYPEPEPETGLALWLDAADSDTLGLDGLGNVEVWGDKSGNGRHVSQGSAGNRPTHVTDSHISNLLAVRFSSGTRIGTDYAPSSIASVFYVKYTTDGGYVLLGSNSTTPFIFHGEDGSGSSLQGGVSAPENYWKDGAIQSLVNADDFYHAYYDQPVIVAGTNFDWSGWSGGFWLAGYTDSRWYFVGDIAEFIVVSGSISQVDIDLVNGYLAHKWGLEANLPADHPHKATSPGAPSFFPAADSGFGVLPAEMTYWHDIEFRMVYGRVELGVISSETGDQYVKIKATTGSEGVFFGKESYLDPTNDLTGSTGVAAEFVRRTECGYLLRFYNASTATGFSAKIVVARRNLDCDGVWGDEATKQFPLVEGGAESLLPKCSSSSLLSTPDSSTVRFYLFMTDRWDVDISSTDTGGSSLGIFNISYLDEIDRLRLENSLENRADETGVSGRLIDDVTQGRVHCGYIVEWYITSSTRPFSATITGNIAEYDAAMDSWVDVPFTKTLSVD